MALGIKTDFDFKNWSKRIDIKTAENFWSMKFTILPGEDQIKHWAFIPAWLDLLCWETGRTVYIQIALEDRNHICENHPKVCRLKFNSPGTGTISTPVSQRICGCSCVNLGSYLDSRISTEICSAAFKIKAIRLRVKDVHFKLFKRAYHVWHFRCGSVLTNLSFYHWLLSFREENELSNDMILKVPALSESCFGEATTQSLFCEVYGGWDESATPATQPL